MLATIATFAAESVDARDDFANLDVEAWHWVALARRSSSRCSSSTCCSCTARPTSSPIKEAAIESAVWISIGLAFGVVICSVWQGGQAGRRVLRRLPDREEPVDRQRLRVGGDLLVLRRAPASTSSGSCSGASSARSCCGPSSSSPASSLIERFEWILYIFGAFLLYTAWKIAHHDETEQVDYNQNIAMRLVRRLVPDHRRVRRPEAVHQARTPSGWPRRCSPCSC